MFTKSLNKLRIATCSFNAGNVKCQCNCLIKYSHKYLVEWHSQNKCIVFHCKYCYKNIVDFLLFQRDLAFYVRAKCCVKFYTEKKKKKKTNVKKICIISGHTC